MGESRGIEDEKRQNGGDEATPRVGPPSFHLATGSSIGRTIAVMSGKGGVGKSAVASMLAVEIQRRGNHVAVMDADITGSSIPKGLGVAGDILVSPEGGAIPATSGTGIKVMSMNLILPQENDAVIWRGPLVSGVVRQFYEQTDWGEVDFLVIDLPPGTSDVPLTIMQSIPLDGIVLVTSPQELAGVIVAKAEQMAKALEEPVIGLVENMSFITCPKCGEVITPFSSSHGEEAAEEMGIPFLGRLPLDPKISELADAGRLEDYSSGEMGEIVDAIVSALQ
jgi:Mrp family chromosome partitioning ATPase